MNILKNKKAIFLFLFPALLIYTVLVFLPIIESVYYSLIEWNGVADQKFVGLSNFTLLIKDKVFLKSLVNNLIYILVVMSTQIIIGLIVAVLVSYLVKFRGLIRTLYYIPSVITVVAIAQLFRWIYSYEPLGLLNNIIMLFGMEPIAWLSNYDTVLICVSFVEGWQYIGIYMLIFYSALMSVPNDIIEAAKIDGAIESKLLLHIKLPYIKNVIGLSLILSLVGALRGFAVPLILTRGGPGYQTEIMATYMFKKAFQSMKLGYGSAIAVVIVLISFIGVITIRRATQNEKL